MTKTKIILLLLLALFIMPAAGAAEYTVKSVPNPRLADRNSYVSNPDGIISSINVQAINRALRQLEDSLGVEVAVVALESIGENDARMFATELFKAWGIGKKGVDNGLLIQLITEPSQRSVVFETGYGLEGVLPDAICYRIQQQYMIEDLRAGDYSDGMFNGVMAVKDYLFASDLERSEMIGDTEEMDETIAMILVIFCVIVCPLLILAFAIFAYFWKRRKQKCPRCGRKTLAYVKRETLRAPTYQAEGLAADIYRCSNCGYTRNKKHTISRLQRSAGPIIIGGGGLGGSRGGGFGGGFGGGSFGGGRSGGGGSISRF
ncbi:TPM domain-containing protein [Parabacteroides sp. OttesenSCG-928-K15]|nr:TPM domain-containing protein [Parabacteroides sp. OttesenSCG-928-K15]